jgi:dihydroorotase
MDRREFLKDMGTTAAGMALPSALRAASSFGLLLKGGRAFISGRFEKCDIGISERRIAAIYPPGETKAHGKKEIDCSGMYISPGWVDLHAHLVPPSHKKIGSPLSRIGAPTGVTALLDAGTTGANNYHMFEKHVAAVALEDVFALINIKRDGIRIRDLYRLKPGLEDLELMERITDENPLIKGLKIRASVEDSVRSDPLYYVRKIREAGDLLGLPVMIHIASPPPDVSEIYPYMREGDIITHALRGMRHNILDEKGCLRTETRDALDRGISIDIGHGFGSFSFDAAERALGNGFKDFTISSDLYSISAPMHARTFSNVMTQFLAIGMSLEEVVERASTRPARILGIEREIAKGSPASLTIFRVPSGEFVCKDCSGEKRLSRKRIFPEWTIHKGQIIRAGDIDRNIYS